MISLIALIIAGSLNAVAADPIRDLYRKVNSGASIDPSSVLYGRMKAKWAAGDRIGAAEIAMQNPMFYDVTLRRFASRMLTLDAENFAPIDDFQLAVIGTIRDRLDFRKILTENFRYDADVLQDFEKGRADYNPIFERLGIGARLQYVLKRATPQYAENFNLKTASGVLTTRGFAERYFSAGTNRRAVDASFQMFLCAPIAEWKDASLPDDRVRRDVDRLPGGNPATYQNECRACHAPMDGLVGAFAKWDFRDGRVFYLADAIFPKNNSNPQNYPEGFIAADDSYVNYLAGSPSFRWAGKTTGAGVAEYGAMLAASDRFGECMVQRAFESMCKKSMKGKAKLRGEFAAHLAKKGFDMIELFARIAADESCRN